MMLNSDLCMFMQNQDGIGKQATWSDLKSDNGRCCTWIRPSDLDEFDISFPNNEPFCGATLGTVVGGGKTECCGDINIDCDTLPGSGPAVDHVFEFAGDNDAFLEAYLEAWKIATENGFDDDELTRLIDGTGTWETTTALAEEK